MHVSLIGGGWTPAAAPLVWGPFLAASARFAAGSRPRVVCFVVDEGDGAAQFERVASALTAVWRCDPRCMLVAVDGGPLDPHALVGAHGMLVCGGLTPAYARALIPQRAALTRHVRAGTVAYAGFSAGASVAARRAIVGGWRHGGTPVCPQEASEDLDDVSVVSGLALVDFAVEVHATQWETLGRLRAALSQMPPGSRGVGIDEDTAVVLDGGEVSVQGLGRAAALQLTSSGEIVQIAVDRL